MERLEGIEETLPYKYVHTAYLAISCTGFSQRTSSIVNRDSKYEKSVPRWNIVWWCGRQEILSSELALCARGTTPHPFCHPQQLNPSGTHIWTTRVSTYPQSLRSASCPEGSSVPKGVLLQGLQQKRSIHMIAQYSRSPCDRENIHTRSGHN